MNRRGFLGALLKFGAALLLPPLPIFAKPEPEPDAPAGLPFIDEVVSVGSGFVTGVSLPAGIYDMKGRALLLWDLAWAVSWFAPPGEGIGFTEERPIVLRAGAGTQLMVTYWADGELRQLTRDGEWGQDLVLEPAMGDAVCAPGVRQTRGLKRLKA